MPDGGCQMPKLLAVDFLALSAGSSNGGSADAAV
jgi:hypothetical protein